MRIRPATLADTPGLGTGMKRVADEDIYIGTQHDRTTEELTERFRASLEGDWIVLVLEDEDEHRLMGVIWLQPETRGVFGLGMWILPEARGAGWGRRLLEAVLDAGREAGARKIVLEVFPENGRALALYASSGFEVEGYRRDHWQRLDGTVRSSVLMAHFPARPRQ